MGATGALGSSCCATSSTSRLKCAVLGKWQQCGKDSQRVKGEAFPTPTVQQSKALRRSRPSGRGRSRPYRHGLVDHVDLVMQSTRQHMWRTYGGDPPRAPARRRPAPVARRTPCSTSIPAPRSHSVSSGTETIELPSFHVGKLLHNLESEGSKITAEVL